MPHSTNTALAEESDAPSLGYRPEDHERRRLLRSYLNVSMRILSKRMELGLSQGSLGRAAGSKQSKISEIELMKGNPRFDTLDRIALELGLAIDLVPRESAVAVAWQDMTRDEK